MDGGDANGPWRTLHHNRNGKVTRGRRRSSTLRGAIGGGWRLRPEPTTTVHGLEGGRAMGRPRPLVDAQTREPQRWIVRPWLVRVAAVAVDRSSDVVVPAVAAAVVISC